MKTTHLISLTIIFLFLFSACRKKDSVVPAIKETNTTSTTSGTTYPFTDTFYGQYHEYNQELAPYNYNGYSTVFVHHITADSITIMASSIGLPRANMDYPANINVATHTNTANTYSFQVQWWEDRMDNYKCLFANDTLHCDIFQTTACAGNKGSYSGYYTGYR